MRKLNRILLLAILLLPLGLRAQYDAPIRVELETAKDQNDYHFAPAGENGAFVFYEGNSGNPDSTRWVFLHYDTNLVRDYFFTLTFPAYTEYISSAKSDHYIYFLLQKRFPKKERVESFLLTIGLENNHYNLKTIPELQSRDVARISAIDDQMVFYASGSKQDSIYLFHAADDDLLCIGDIFPYRFEFCAPDTFNHRWLIGLTQAKNESPGDIFLYDYNYISKKGRIQSFPGGGGSKGSNLYNSARAVALSADSVLIAGTYNTLQDRYSSNTHSGVYTMMLHDWEFDTARFYNYSMLKNGKEETAAARASNLNLQLLIGDITHNGKQFAFVTEVIYPEYTYNYNPYESYYGATSTASTTTFNGYRYVNAYITTFDRSGNLLWDSYFPYSNITLFNAQSLLKANFNEDDALLYYTRNNRIVSTLVNGYEVLEKVSSINIETSNSYDAVDYNRNTQIVPWYGRYYLVTGYQYVKNRNKAVKAKRYVFYINKLEYR